MSSPIDATEMGDLDSISSPLNAGGQFEKYNLPSIPKLSQTTSEEHVPDKISYLPALPSSMSRPAISAMQSFQRPRKRVLWRGKVCVVALPLDDGLSARGENFTFLKSEDVAERLAGWERRGYDVRGFDLTITHLGQRVPTSEGQSRQVYPDPEEGRREWQQGMYRISVPDRRDWDAYVEGVKEDRLRALGVTSGDEDPPTRQTSTNHITTRQSSSQQSTSIISPPINSPYLPTPSAQQFSPISPDPQHRGGHGKMHYPSHSMAILNGDRSWEFVPNAQYYDTTATTSSTSPSRQDLHAPAGWKAASSSLDKPMKNAEIPLKPLQKLTPQSDPIRSSGDDLLARMREQQAQLQRQLIQQQHQQQQQQLDPLSRSFDGLPAFLSHPDIASPKPQGHQHNLSETLQREIDEAETHLQRSGRLQSDNEESTYGFPLVNGYAIQRHQFAPPGDDRRVSKATVSDLDTNPSLTSTPDLALLQHTVEWPPDNHRRPTSTSKLNGEAQEFQLESKLSSGPSIFSFIGHETPHAGTRRSHVTSKPSRSHSRDQPRDSNDPVSSSLNGSAPAFTPASEIRPSIPSRVFSFSSSGPAFKPDAPVFEPSSDIYKERRSDLSNSEASTTASKKIFGDVKLSDMIKPVKQSKAIPIVKPKQVHNKFGQKSEGEEDESGRITQADGRQKRLRRNDNDADQVPLFATPTRFYPGNDGGSQNQRFEMAYGESRQRGTAASKTAQQLGSLFQYLPTSKVSGPEKALEPFEFGDAADAATFSAALPTTYSPKHKLQQPSEATCNEIRQSEASDYDGRINRTPIASPSLPGLKETSLDPIKNPFDTFKDSRIAQDNEHSDSLLDSRWAPADLQEQTSKAATNRPIHQSNAYHGDAVDGVDNEEPSFEEIDAVMKHLDQEAESGVERSTSSRGQASPAHGLTVDLREALAPALLQRSPTQNDRTEPRARKSRNAPLVSPEQYQYLTGSGSEVGAPNVRDGGDSESANTAEIEASSRNGILERPSKPKQIEALNPSSVHRLNILEDIPISDWDDAISSNDETKVHSRSQFFDKRINDLVGGIVQERLGPLEKTLETIQVSLADMTSNSGSKRDRRSHSSEIEHSDADDEEEVDGIQQPRSLLKDRKFEKLKHSLLEAITFQQASIPSVDSSNLMKAVVDLKESISEARQTQPENIKDVVEEAVARQMRGRSKPITNSQGSAAAEKLQLQVSGLESMLTIADTRANEELKARRKTEDVLADTQRLLHLARQDAAEQRESAEETERSLQTFHDERQHQSRHLSNLEIAQENLQSKVSELSEKNSALEGTLEEYRLSSVEWRKEIEEAQKEDKELKQTMHGLKEDIKESVRIRHNLRSKLEHLQSDMTSAAQEIARDQSLWRRREDEHKFKYSLLESKLEAEVRGRESLELEVARLAAQEKEAITAKFVLEETQNKNQRLVAAMSELDEESNRHRKAATRLQQELYEVTESARLADQQTKLSSNQLEVIRVELEGDIARLQKQLENATTDAEKAKSRHDLMLEEASQSRYDALREAAEAREAALQEHYRFHERTLKELGSKHERELANALEDKQRSEMHVQDRLALSDEKVRHYQDHINHLEDKLEIAKSAAAAAVQAVQNAKITKIPPAAAISATTSSAVSRDVELPEKVSPQALRESIMALQDQLQDRESRIETLTSSLAALDATAPAKLKDCNAEIFWLRELLNVRVDDLQDIITTLSRPDFDRDAVKDAAIRLKANLQMEQQERERAAAAAPVGGGGGGDQASPPPQPPLLPYRPAPSLSSVASSPRQALPLAAAAAWGNWRKVRDSGFANLSELATGVGSTVAETPSRASPYAPGWMSGLLTPPGTSARSLPSQSPPPPLVYAPARSAEESRRPLGKYSNGGGGGDAGSRGKTGALVEHKKEPPKTPSPSLMRIESYDADAESREFVDGDADGEGSEWHETDSVGGDGSVGVVGRARGKGKGNGDGDGLGPFGPEI